MAFRASSLCVTSTKPKALVKGLLFTVSRELKLGLKSITISCVKVPVSVDSPACLGSRQVSS